jgi:hypothetical protein
LGYYDFFSANPYIVVSGETDADRSDRLTLRMAGFSDQQLSYASSGERFVSRRKRIQHDMSLLVAYGIVTIGETGYTLTERGHQLAQQLQSVYADAYRSAAEIVVTRLSRLTDRKLREQAQSWLGHSWLLLDFLDDVTEATPMRTVPGTSTGGGSSA